MKKFLKKRWFLILSFMIPVILMLIHAIVHKIWFTGNGSILVGDSMVQILPMYHELWNKVHGGESLSYTWNIGGGMDYSSLVGYTPLPFSILMLIVPKNQIANMLQLTIVLKWALSSLTATFFFYKTKFNTIQSHKELFSLFLGLGFSLSNGVVYFVSYPQLVDPVICLPLLLLLIEKMYEEKTWKLYYLILSLSMLSCLYMTYMVCIFLFIWFVFVYEKKYKRDMKKICLRFFGGSILAAVTMITCIYQLLYFGSDRIGQEGADYYRLEYAKQIIVDPVTFVKQLFVLNPLARANVMTPNLYVSVIGVSLIPFLLLVKMDKVRKIKLILIELFLCLSINFGGLSLLWHGFSVPNGVYHRQMFIVVLMTMFVIMQIICSFDGLSCKKVIGVAVVEIVTFLVTFLMIKIYDSFWIYLTTFMIMFLTFIVLFLFCKASISYKQLVAFISFVGILELSVNAYNSLIYYSGKSYEDINRYGAEKIFKEDIQLNPGERMQSIFANNNGAVFDLPSNEGFASCISQTNLHLHERLGLGVYGAVGYSEVGGSPLINLIFNNRYGIADCEQTFSDCELVKDVNGIRLYRMNRLAGLGYMVDDKLTDWDIDIEDCFEVQNDFVKLAVDGKPFFKRVDVDLKTMDSEGNGLMYAKTNKKEYYVYSTIKYSSVYDSIQAEFVADHDMDLYSYLIGDCNLNDVFKYYIYIDDELIMIDDRGSVTETIHIGNVKKGQKVSIVRMPMISEGSLDEETTWELVFEEFDEEAYNESYKKLSKNVYNIDTFKDDYIKGTIHAEDDGLMMTSIIADDIFYVMVDGEETEYKRIANTMIAVPLKEGVHEVEFVYDNSGIMNGWTTYLPGLAIFTLLCLLETYVKFRQKQI